MLYYIALTFIGDINMDKAILAKTKKNPFANETENDERRAAMPVVRDLSRRMLNLKNGTTWYDHPYWEIIGLMTSRWNGSDSD